MSYVEIYKENVRDLLEKKPKGELTSLRLREPENGRVPSPAPCPLRPGSHL